MSFKFELRRESREDEKEVEIYRIKLKMKMRLRVDDGVEFLSLRLRFGFELMIRV